MMRAQLAWPAGLGPSGVRHRLGMPSRVSPNNKMKLLLRRRSHAISWLARPPGLQVMGQHLASNVECLKRETLRWLSG